MNAEMTNGVTCFMTDLPRQLANRRFGKISCWVSTTKMGRPTGLEPATPRFTILCSNQLSYDRRKVLKGHFRG